MKNENYIMEENSDNMDKGSQSENPQINNDPVTHTSGDGGEGRKRGEPPVKRSGQRPPGEVIGRSEFQENKFVTEDDFKKFFKGAYKLTSGLESLSDEWREKLSAQSIEVEDKEGKKTKKTGLDMLGAYREGLEAMKKGQVSEEAINNISAMDKFLQSEEGEEFRNFVYKDVLGDGDVNKGKERYDSVRNLVKAAREEGGDNAIGFDSISEETGGKLNGDDVKGLIEYANNPTDDPKMLIRMKKIYHGLKDFVFGKPEWKNIKKGLKIGGLAMILMYFILMGGWARFWEQQIERSRK